MAALAAVLPRQRVDLRGPAPEPARGGPQVRAAGRHAPQHGGGEGAGGLHPRQGAGRRGGAASRTRARRAPSAPRSARPTGGRPARRTPLPRLRRDRGARPTRARPARTPSASGARSTARGPSSTCSCPARKGRAVEQAAAGRGLGARHQRQLLPEGAGRGRQRDARGEGASWRRSSVTTLTLPRWFGRTRSAAPAPPPSRAKLRIGIPRVLNLWSTHQFWVGFFGALGVDPRHARLLLRHLRGAGAAVRQGPRHRGLLLSGEVHRPATTASWSSASSEKLDILLLADDLQPAVVPAAATWRARSPARA